MKAEFFMLPKRIVEAMKESSKMSITEKPIAKAFKGETWDYTDPRSAEVRIPGASDALTSAGWDLAQVGVPPASYKEYTILHVIYHELTHAWIWLQEFYDAEIGDLYRAGLDYYKHPIGVNGTEFKPEAAFTEAAAYYVGGRVQRWLASLRSLDVLLRDPPADRVKLEGLLKSVAEAYDSVPTDAKVKVGPESTEQVASPAALSKALRDALDEKFLEGGPLTEPFDDTPFAGLRASLLAG
jgi:hypothetical protein